MSKKQKLVEKLMEKFSIEELEELFGEVETPDPPEVIEEESEGESHIFNPKKRRGSGHNKRGKKKSSRNSRGRKTKARKGSSGKACRVLPFETDANRENRFDEFIGATTLDENEKAELKESTESDKKDRKKRKSFTKSNRPSTFVEVRCKSCGVEEEVSGAIVQRANNYRCNECAAGR